MASHHEEEVLGKAYDSRLMQRILRYLRSYRWQVTVALVSIVLKAGADAMGPCFVFVGALPFILAVAPQTAHWVL
jgi:ATP-binding cassette subfamily B multidrug efflux pump